MNVLVVGASDTLGTYLPDKEQGTFNILKRELPGVLHEDTTVDHMRFYSHFKDAPKHAERQVRERAPDITIIAAHSMAFSTQSVGARLVHIFGWKVGRWVEKRVWGVDATAREHGTVARIRDPLRRLARRSIGVAAYASVEDTIRDYGEALTRLSKIEDMEVLLLGTFQPRRDGDLAKNAQLNAGLAAAAAARRIPWIDRQAIVTALGVEAFQENGLYSSPLTHRRVADAVLAALAR